MRLFLLENAKAGNVVRAIVCAPDHPCEAVADSGVFAGENRTFSTHFDRREFIRSGFAASGDAFRHRKHRVFPRHSHHTHFSNDCCLRLQLHRDGAPDAASSVSSDRAITFVTPDGSNIVLRQVGQSEFAVTQNQTACDANELHASVVRAAENLILLDIVYSADNCQAPALSFLDEHERVPVKRTLAQISRHRETRLCDVWSFQVNLAALRDFETRLRTESVVASLVVDLSDIESNRYSDELSQVASNAKITANLFLPLQAEISGSMVPCVVRLQATDELGNFAAEIYWREADAPTAGQTQLRNVEGDPLLMATIL